MAVITEDAIRELAAFRGEKAPVTSCYLDVDGRRWVRRQDYESELDRLLKVARDKADGSGSVARDVKKIDEWVRAGFDRSSTRGLAFFSCSAHDLFRVIELPVSVRNRVSVNQMPAVGQLESLVLSYERIGVLLADRQRARMFMFEFGELTEHSELVEELPRDYDSRGHSEKGSEREQHHVEELAQQHLRHAAKVAFEVLQGNGFDSFTIGAPEPIARELESYLHPYLRDRLCGHINVLVGASLDEIRNAALELEAGEHRRREAEVVQRLRDALGSGQPAVAGLEPTLRALSEHRVERLVVSSGYSEAGWSCGSCGALAAIGRTCPACGAAGMAHLDDVVEDAVEHALVGGVKVDLCEGNADLDVLGRIGAILRF